MRSHWTGRTYALRPIRLVRCRRVVSNYSAISILSVHEIPGWPGILPDGKWGEMQLAMANATHSVIRWAYIDYMALNS
jgi:hypothetical protein